MTRDGYALLLAVGILCLTMLYIYHDSAAERQVSREYELAGQCFEAKAGKCLEIIKSDTTEQP